VNYYRNSMLKRDRIRQKQGKNRPENKN